jgi:hypothetical protein
MPKTAPAIIKGSRGQREERTRAAIGRKTREAAVRPVFSPLRGICEVEPTLGRRAGTRANKAEKEL